MNTTFMLFLTAVIAIGCVESFRPLAFQTKRATRSGTGVRSMTAIFDVLAGLSLANQLNSAPIDSRYLGNSFPVAVKETVQGLYKEYTVDRVDDSALDQIKSTYKTAEQTDEKKTQYWAILGVLVFGSFVIPMAQYYWYVAEED